MKKTHLVVKNEKSKPLVCDFVSGTAGVFSGKCPDKESPNEDAALLISLGADTGVLAVADGFGGQASGDEAARLSVESIRESVEDPQVSETELREAILKGFERANRKVQALGVGAASTLAVAEITGNRIRTYHAGDSIILLTGQRGKIIFQNISHSPVGYALTAGFLKEDEAMDHEERHLVSNMIGSDKMHIELGPQITMKKRDTLLLASDGITDNLLLDEIVNTVRKGPVEHVAVSLAENCTLRMETPEQSLPSKPDDATFVVFRRTIRKLSKERNETKPTDIVELEEQNSI